MLTCIYHPIDPCRFVEEDEAQKMQASGIWFDCPNKAKNYRASVEEEIKNESSKVAPIAKFKGKRK